MGESQIDIFVVIEAIEPGEIQVVAAFRKEDNANKCRANILREYGKEYDVAEGTDPDEIADKFNYDISVVETVLRP